MSKARKASRWARALLAGTLLLQAGPCQREGIYEQLRDGVLASFSQFFTIFRD